MKKYTTLLPCALPFGHTASCVCGMDHTTGRPGDLPASASSPLRGGHVTYGLPEFAFPATPASREIPYSHYPTGHLPLPSVPQAPTYHDHTHDVHMLENWIDSAGNDPLNIKKADLVAEGLIDYIMSRSKQHNEFFTELVRQTRVHCPKVATYGYYLIMCSNQQVSLSCPQVTDTNMERYVQPAGQGHCQLRAPIPRWAAPAWEDAPATAAHENKA